MVVKGSMAELVKRARRLMLKNGSPPIFGEFADAIEGLTNTMATNRASIIEECANVVRRHRPDASFDDSSAGYMERHALLKNVEDDIRKLGLDFDELFLG